MVGLDAPKRHLKSSRRPKKGSQEACSIHARPLWASLHRPLWASLGLSVRLCASLRLSGLLWASLGACSDGQFDDIIIIIFWEDNKKWWAWMLPRGT